jgi:arylsulfatase A-like enzyme
MNSIIYKTFAIAIIGVSIIGCAENKVKDAEKSERPNIIFLFTDDQSDRTLSSMGHPVIKTPNLDNLLTQGVWFSNTYIATPICAPSRVCLFTGMHERKHEVGFTNSYQLSEGQWEQTYPALLRDNGYYTGFVGKFGVEYYTFKGKADEKFDFWYGHDGWTQFFPKDFHARSSIPYHGAEEDIITYIMGEGIESFLETVNQDQPFCLSVSFNVPHGSQKQTMYTTQERWQRGLNFRWTELLRPANENTRLKGHPFYDTLYRDGSVVLPEDFLTDPYQHIPRRILNQDHTRASSLYKYNYHPQANYENLIRYYQIISGLDHVIGNMVQSLEERGLLDNTVIIYASDHGLLDGEYGMGGKALLYDRVVKIPCFVYDPRLPENKRGRKVEELVSSLDITSTILDYAGISQPDVMDGQSLLPLVKGEEVEWRKDIFLESLYTGQGNPFIEGIRYGNWKYIRFYVPEKEGHTEEDLDFENRQPDFEQLFNLEHDPTEHNNLISKYEGTEWLEKMRNKCAGYSADLNIKRKAYIEKNEVVLKNN